jgi:nicotinate-nucleotide adenylyltransferase
MEILRRAARPCRRVAILPGAFNPPTRAHLALASASLDYADEALLVLARTLPHKALDGASFDERLEMLLAATEGHSRLGVAVSDGGLFLEIARECKAILGHDLNISLICGRDAAERIVAWDYGEEPPIDAQFREYTMLVAARRGTYQPPEHLASHIAALVLDEEFDWYSASEVRRRIAEGEQWETLVPPSTIPIVRRIYGSGR